jgi:hypothetical protein
MIINILANAMFNFIKKMYTIYNIKNVKSFTESLNFLNVDYKKYFVHIDYIKLKMNSFVNPISIAIIQKDKDNFIFEQYYNLNDLVTKYSSRMKPLELFDAEKIKEEKLKKILELY